MKKTLILLIIGLTLTSFNIKEINTFKDEVPEIFIIEESGNSIDSFKFQSIVKQICQNL